MIRDEDLEYDKNLKICYNCNDYHKIEGTEAGNCKHNAPVSSPLIVFNGYSPNVGNHLAQWPVVHATDICGQFNNDYVEEIKSSNFIDKLLEYFRGG